MKYIYSKLLILMILNLNVGYSQDTTIELEYKIARLIIEDLTTGDQAKEELFFTQEQFGLLNQKIKDLSTQLQLDLKKQKAKTQLFKLGGTTVLIGALVLTIL